MKAAVNNKKKEIKKMLSIILFSILFFIIIFFSILFYFINLRLKELRDDNTDLSNQVKENEKKIMSLTEQIIKLVENEGNLINVITRTSKHVKYIPEIIQEKSKLDILYRQHKAIIEKGIEMDNEINYIKFKVQNMLFDMSMPSNDDEKRIIKQKFIK